MAASRQTLSERYQQQRTQSGIHVRRECGQTLEFIMNKSHQWTNGNKISILYSLLTGFLKQKKTKYIL